MSGLFDLIQQQVSGSAVQQLSADLGVDPTVVQRGVSAALPLILSGMSAHAATPASAETIHVAAASTVNVPGAGVQALPADRSPASGLLGKVVGARAPGIVDSVAKAAGIDPTQAEKIVATLTPMVMSALAMKQSQDALKPGDIESTLQVATQDAKARATQQAPGLSGTLGTLMNEIARS